MPRSVSYYCRIDPTTANAAGKIDHWHCEVPETCECVCHRDPRVLALKEGAAS